LGITKEEATTLAIKKAHKMSKEWCHGKTDCVR